MEAGVLEIVSIEIPTYACHGLYCSTKVSSWSLSVCTVSHSSIVDNESFRIRKNNRSGRLAE